MELIARNALVFNAVGDVVWREAERWLMVGTKVIEEAFPRTNNHKYRSEFAKLLTMVRERGSANSAAVRQWRRRFLPAAGAADSVDSPVAATASPGSQTPVSASRRSGTAAATPDAARSPHVRDAPIATSSKDVAANAVALGMSPKRLHGLKIPDNADDSGTVVTHRRANRDRSRHVFERGPGMQQLLPEYRVPDRTSKTRT